MMQYALGQIVIRRIVESICTEFAPLSFFPVTVCATHFPEPSIGRIVERERAFWFADAAAHSNR
jgi:hypothetical protein